METKKILYIAGFPRSGSTILERVMGEFIECQVVGEVKSILRHGWQRNEECSCTSKFNKCEFWSLVKNEVENSIGQDTINSLLKKGTKGSLKSIKYLIIDSKRKFELKNELEVIFYKAIYQAIFKVSNTNLLIDSSKDPVYAYILSNLEEFETYIIHLVRDARGSYYSFWKENKKSYISRWPIYQYGSKLLKKKVKNHYLLVNYEDFTNDPMSVIKSILNLIDEDSSGNEFYDRTIKLQPVHILSGNPNRFRYGNTKIKNDDKWKEKLPLGFRLWIGLITVPFRKILGI